MQTISKMLNYKNITNKIIIINYWSTESAVAIVIIQIKILKTLSKKLNNQKMFLFNKKCFKYFCDSISISFTEVHWDLIFDASHTLCGYRKMEVDKLIFRLLLISHQKIQLLTNTYKSVRQLFLQYIRKDILPSLFQYMPKHIYI